jgi:protein ImuB
MSRIVSVWLKAWPIARLLRAQACAPADAVDPGRPLVLVAPGKGGACIFALNRAAQRGGLVIGELLSNARSKVLDLQTRDADPAADAAALRKLALWCLRYTPIVASWDEISGADGLFLNITGCAHLFGGEKQMLADLAARLRSFGLVPRLAIADTAGAAWALARYGDSDHAIIPVGAQSEALKRLPLAALRLSEATQLLMRRLGFRRIGELIDQPRAPFAARFDGELLARLDQALGHAPEPLAPIVSPPVYRSQALFAEPIFSKEHVLEAATRLLKPLAKDLVRKAVGARLLRLLLFRVDGGVLSLDLGLAAPSRDVRHIVQLIGLRLYRLGGEFEADFGFEAAAVHVLVAERLAERQSLLGMGEECIAPDGLARLIDRLQQRLGPGAVHQLIPYQSHIPERAVRSAPPSPRASPTFQRTPSVRGEDRGERQEQAQAQVSSRGLSPGSRVRRAPSDIVLAKLDRAEIADGWIPGIKPGMTVAWEVPKAPSAPRPLLLLPQPEAIEVVALIPEGPPRQFRWRGVLHQVAATQGPERIAPEWWHRTGEVERDYYLAEDREGRRFWLYRAGLYGRGDAAPQWFMHGVFG